MKVVTKKVEKVEKKAEEEAERVTQLRDELEEAMGAFVRATIYTPRPQLFSDLNCSLILSLCCRWRRLHRLPFSEKSFARKKW